MLIGAVNRRAFFDGRDDLDVLDRHPVDLDRIFVADNQVGELPNLD